MSARPIAPPPGPVAAFGASPDIAHAPQGRGPDRAAPPAAPASAPGAPGRTHLLDMHGLIHDSAWPVHGAHPAPPGAAPDILVRPGILPPAPQDAPRLDDARILGPGRLQLEARGMRMLVEAGARVTLDAPGLPEDLRRLLVGYAAGTLLLLQRGRLPLHAAAVAGPGGAVLLLGESGAGKSTLATMLAPRGLQLVGDDMIAMAVGAADGAAEGSAAVDRSLRAAKLWRDSTAAAGLDGAGAADQGAGEGGDGPLENLSGIEKSVLAWDGTGADIPFPAPLRAIIRLGWLHPGAASPRLTPLSPLQALPLIRGAVARAPLAGAMGLGPRHMALAAAVAGAAPAFALDRPRRFDATAQTLDLVARLASTGAA